MTDKTLERIKEEADKFSKHLVFNADYKQGIMQGFIDGAKSERKKVIEEMLIKLDSGYKDYVWYKHLRLEIESLKL